MGNIGVGPLIFHLKNKAHNSDKKRINLFLFWFKKLHHLRRNSTSYIMEKNQETIKTNLDIGNHFIFHINWLRVVCAYKQVTSSNFLFSFLNISSLKIIIPQHTCPHKYSSKPLTYVSNCFSFSLWIKFQTRICLEEHPKE